MMAASQGSGNFRDLKTHLPLFDEAVHRHDRGWPHPPPGESNENPRRRWKRVGIFHFPHHGEDEGEDEGEGEARNADSD